MTEYNPSGNNRKLIRMASTLLIAASISYVLFFAITVRKGHASYEMDSPEKRGSFVFYWFSEQPTLNRAGCKLFHPVFWILLDSRPYSSFQTELDRISWCEQGNDIVMDDLTAVGIPN